MNFRALEKSIRVLEKSWKSPGNLFLKKGMNPVKKSKAGHLSKITKIYHRLNEHCMDYKFLSEVRSETNCLDAQGKQYTHVYYDLIQVLPDGGAERKHEENCHAEHNKIYYGYIKSIDQYVIGSEKEVTKAAGSKGTVADDNFMELTQIVT